MSLSHKAYVFDYERFEVEFAPLLYQALADGETTRLVQFVDQNLDTLTWPWEPDPLPATWQEELRNELDAIEARPLDAHAIGDLGLTKYYSSGDDEGLAQQWSLIREQLSEECQAALLGNSFGPKDNSFDPGKMGSYFQDPQCVQRSVAALSRVGMQALDPYIALLLEARENRVGLYVTF